MKQFVLPLLSSLLLVGTSCSTGGDLGFGGLDPVDEVNPYMGNISHLLVPTYPTVQLPNAMMRVIPARTSYTDEQIEGLPLLLTSHRGQSAFSLSPLSSLSDSVPAVVRYMYDEERTTPYSYHVYLPEEEVVADYAPSFQSGIYRLRYDAQEGGRYLLVSSATGELTAEGKSLSGYEILEGDSTKRVYVYLELEGAPERIGRRDASTGAVTFAEGQATAQTIVLDLGKRKEVNLRYGVSYISTEQAKRNVEREIQIYELDVVAKAGRHEWNKVLGQIEVSGGTDAERRVFYTSLYRTYERMINLSEDGKYWSGTDGQVHDDGGIPFYTDDWVWDTYLATHPLRILLDPQKEQAMLTSYLRMAQESSDGWLPTFPEVHGDTHRMNGTHSISLFADAYVKGLSGFDMARAYEVSKRTMQEKSYLPWTRMPKGALSQFMDERGYFPALRPGEQETDPRVTKWEKRQAVAVTQGAAFDYWSLSQMASSLGHDEDAKHYLRQSYIYRNLFNYETNFFHPKDKDGKFIQPFNYENSGGLGARDYYDENNAYTYRWGVQHNPADLIYLMGGKDRFIQALDETFRTPLSESKWAFYSHLPDQTGNVGQFSMGNEPSMHIPYLYNYAGAPWRTQRSIRKLLASWFRDDLMGVPGDEDGGGLSAFVVFSMMGIYPVTPGLPVYNIGSPIFPSVSIRLGSGTTFTIEADGVSAENKYIQSAKLNGKELNRPWIKHKELIEGGVLSLKMGNRPNKEWGATSPPPSAERIDLTPTDRTGLSGKK